MWVKKGHYTNLANYICVNNSEKFISFTVILLLKHQVHYRKSSNPQSTLWRKKKLYKHSLQKLLPETAIMRCSGKRFPCQKPWEVLVKKFSFNKFRGSAPWNLLKMSSFIGILPTFCHYFLTSQNSKTAYFYREEILLKCTKGKKFCHFFSFFDWKTTWLWKS